MTYSSNLDRFIEACTPELSTGAKRLLLLCFEYFRKKDFPPYVAVPLSRVVKKAMISSLCEEDYEDDLKFSIRDILSTTRTVLLFDRSTESFGACYAITQIWVDKKDQVLYMWFSEDFLNFVKVKR